MTARSSGERHGAGTGTPVSRRARASAALADWVRHDEKLVVDARFGGDRELYAAWRDRLWTEMHDRTHDPDRRRECGAEEEHVVLRVFDGDWAQYRLCRDRLREELWRIMKATSER